MEKKQKVKANRQAGGVTHKKDLNAGSGAFNQGSEQDPDYNKGTKVSDEEKKSKIQVPRAVREREADKGADKV